MEAGEHEAVGERHARWFLALVEEAEPALRGPRQVAWLQRLRAEDDNLQQALAWCRGRGADQADLGLRLAGALGWYWYVGRQVDGRRELAAMLAAASTGSPLGRARVLQALSLALRPAGCIVHPSSEAADAARESLALFAAADDAGRAAISRLLVAVESVGGKDVPTSLAEVETARATFRALDDRWSLALADFVEMEIRLRNGDDEDALPLGEAAARTFEHLGDDWGRSAVPMHLGAGLRLAGRPATPSTCSTGRSRCAGPPGWRTTSPASAQSWEGRRPTWATPRKLNAGTASASGWRVSSETRRC